ELRRGVEAIRARDAKQAAALERWLTRLETDHAERILPVDAPVAHEWGRLAARRTASVIDTLMAATAIVYGLTLVTRNVKDVAWTGVTYLDPFEGSTRARSPSRTSASSTAGRSSSSTPPSSSIPAKRSAS